MFAAYEDAFYYLWRERRLPTNVDPFASNLEDAGERERLAQVFEQGLDAAVGYVFPIGRTADGRRWETGPWFLRRERCYLIPGDSPVGLPSAARFDAVGCASGLSVHAFSRSVSGVPAAAAALARFVGSSATSIPRDRRKRVGARRPKPKSSGARSSKQLAAARAGPAATRKDRVRVPRDRATRARHAPRPAGIRSLDHAHRHVRRAARRRAVHLHAADRRGSRTTSSSSPRWKPQRKRSVSP